MDKLVAKLGFYSSIITAVLVVLIDVGMISSAILFPMTSIANIQDYTNTFSSLQMLPFIPSLILAPLFVVMIVCIHQTAPENKKILGQLGIAFAAVCAAILSIHYYIQLTIVQQGMLSNETTNLWQLAAPNPHSLFWTLSALGYGFMGIALLCTAFIFAEKSEHKIKWLFIANGVVGIAFLVGNAVGFFMGNIIASFTWGMLFPIAALLLANKFRKTPA
jgi:hypothetical protein